jgi:hypothetical protein
LDAREKGRDENVHTTSSQWACRVGRGRGWLANASSCVLLDEARRRRSSDVLHLSLWGVASSRLPRMHRDVALVCVCVCAAAPDPHSLTPFSGCILGAGGRVSLFPSSPLSPHLFSTSYSSARDADAVGLSCRSRLTLFGWLHHRRGRLPAGPLAGEVAAAAGFCPSVFARGVCPWGICNPMHCRARAACCFPGDTPRRVGCSLPERALVTPTRLAFRGPSSCPHASCPASRKE